MCIFLEEKTQQKYTPNHHLSTLYIFRKKGEGSFFLIGTLKKLNTDNCINFIYDIIYKYILVLLLFIFQTNCVRIDR